MRVILKRTIKNIISMRYDSGSLYVTANLFVTKNKIKRIIEQNAAWINSRKGNECGQQTEFEENKKITYANVQRADAEQQQLVKDIFAGKKTIILGDIVSVEPSISGKTYMDGGTLYIGEKYYNDKDMRIKAIKSYLKKIAFLFVASEVSSFGTNVSLCPQKIEFKDIADTWCKCSLAAQKILCFDYRLTQLPQNLRSYIIAHAFAHFQFATHSDAFWNHVSNVIPHYRDIEKQLEKYDFLRDI